MSLDDQTKQARILVVDDQPANVKLLERLLRSAGFSNVVGFTDPRKAVTAYRDNGFDLVLLDIRMPHLSGYEVMAKLREMEPDSYIPVLVLTAQTDQETRLQALESGAKDFLTKPFNRIEVLSRINNMLEVRLLHNQVRNQNRVLEEKVRARTKELHDTRLDVIRRLGRAAEYRDNETGLHIIRMSKFAEIIARNAGFNRDYCDLILTASPMHDVGKLGIPDHVLKKPGKLDPHEWEIMKTHTTMGAELLAGGSSELLDTAQRIALSHHERWDGSGYPRGLAGEEIPLEGRISAISDVFDALTSERPYKRAWSEEEAIAEINRQRGIQFDPALVEVFLHSIAEISRVKAEFKEPPGKG